VGGINLFAGAITAASTVIVGITNNLDILGTGLAAAMAGFIAFTVGSNFSAILGGMGKIRTAILALNTAIMANPIGFIASAIAIAATAIIMNFDKMKNAAGKAAVNIEISFQKLKIFLLGSFASAINKVGNGFTTMKNDAIAGMTALAAAVKNPTNAIDAFNDTFDTTLESLQSGKNRTNLFSNSIADSERRVDELNEQLAGMNTEIVEADDNYQDAGRSLSDYATEIDESAVAANELAAETEAARVKTLELLGEISNETEALSMSNVEIAIRNNLQKAGVDATSELGEQIVAATEQLYAEKDAIDAANESAKALERQHDESQKAIEAEAKRVAEEQSKAYEEMKNNISGFFMDLFENGRDAFDNIAKTFKNMILQMLADWAASKIAEVMNGTFSGIGSSISSMFSGIFSSISSSISGLASSAASVLSSVVGGGGGGGAGVAASIAGAAGAAGQFISGALGTATGVAAGTVGPPTAAALAGSGLTSTIAAGGAKLAALATNPVTLTVAAIATAAKLLDDSGTMSANAGLITDQSINLGDRGFTVPKFASGAQFQGFNRREDQATADSVVEAFATLDSTLTAAAKSVGITPNLNAASFVGSSETGRGIGAFLGTASEDGSTKSASLQEQLDSYATQWVNLVGNQSGVDPAVIAEVIGEGTAEGILSRTHPDGSHRDGLDMVPHDGYVAELHAGERVQTAEQARSSDSMADQISGLRQSVEEVMIAVARNTGKLYRLNDRWDKNGLPPVRA
jgi:uncharacterized protein Yka (UPF0111/DUF47 family)